MSKRGAYLRECLAFAAGRPGRSTPNEPSACRRRWRARRATDRCCMSPATKTPSTLVMCPVVARDEAARILLQPRCSTRSVRPGATKPMASSTRSASSVKPEPATRRGQAARGSRRRPTPPARTGPARPSPSRRRRRWCRRSSSAGIALLVAAGVAPHERPLGPGRGLGAGGGRLGQDLELDHLSRALPPRGADAVGAGVAAADHHHALALRP